MVEFEQVVLTRCKMILMMKTLDIGPSESDQNMLPGSSGPFRK